MLREFLDFMRACNIGKTQRPLHNCQIVQSADQVFEYVGLRRLRSLGAEFFQTTDCQPRLAQSHHAALQVPLSTNLSSRCIQHGLRRILLIELARDLRNAGESRHIRHCGVRGSNNGCNWRNWLRRCCRRRVLRHQACGHVELMQVRIAFFFVGKQLLNSLQAFQGLVAHPILHQDFRLQHQILQRTRTYRFLFIPGRCNRRCASEARCDHLEPVLVNLAFQHRQPLLMTLLV